MSKSRRPTSSPTEAEPASAAPEARPAEHPLLAAIGRELGLGTGIAVTELLRLVPGWTDPVLGEDGQPAQRVPGAQRIGDHDIERRHEEVVGPQIQAYGDTLDGGWWRDLVEGFGAGATEAPGEDYRLGAEAEDGLSALADRLRGN